MLRLAVIAVVLGCSQPTLAQSDAVATMREGNSLLRMDLTRTALLRYREAADAGLDTPLLHYNIGVARYRLGEFDEAVAEFTKAYSDPGLAALAAYNLGLSHRAAGRDEQARLWFERAKSSTATAALRDLTELALRQVDASRAAPQRTVAGPAPVGSGEFRLTLRAGYGSDDNPNRSPTDPYVDLSQTDEPLTQPDPVETSYVPIDLIAEYVLHNEPGDTDFVFGYELDGDYYGEYYANDEITQRLRIGADIDLEGKANRHRNLSSSLFATHHWQRDFDLEDGVDRVIADEYELYRRFMYLGAGVDTDFSHTLGPWAWGFGLRFEHRDYDEVPIVADFDDNLYVLKIHAAYALNAATTVGVGLQRYRRAFDRLPSRGLDGALLSANPPLEYTYSAAELNFDRAFLGDRFAIEATYRRIDRTDEFAGYEDYVQDAVALRASYRARSKLRLSAGFETRSYEYPNAFAFNNPAAGPRELEDSVADLSAEYRLNRRWSIIASLAFTDVTSTDTRAAYTRTRSALGAIWSL